MADPKKRSGFVLPQIVDPPRKCVKIWIPDEVYHRGAFWGSIFELTQAFNWQQNPPSKAREVADIWFQIWSDATKENDGMGCCTDPALTYRINPETGNVEQSANGGTTWTPAAGGVQSVIVQPVPPVTSGTSATKCDAATNVGGQVNVWITQVSDDFTTAVTLLDFGIAVLEAILVAVLTVLSAGALTPLEALVLPTLGAALTAAWGAGKAAFDAYWTTDIKDKILCAAYCNIGADGSFTDAQFSAFWHQVNGDLPPSPAKMLFMGFLSSVGKEGLNAMAGSGLSADSDCSDCPCAPCSNKWSIFGAGHGSIVAVTDDYIEVQSSPDTGGDCYVIIKTANQDVCCHVDHVEVLTGSIALNGWTDCGQPQVEGVPQHTGIGFGTCCNYVQLQDAGEFTARIYFTPCP